MLASLTSSVTSLVVHHGVLAVFLLLMVDAVLPVGGELPMLLSGAVAAGAVGHGTSLLGHHVPSGIGSYLVLASAGAVGYVVGSIAGWAVGRRGGRELVERHGRWLHLGPARMAQAERWFARRGSLAVLLGRVTPLVRSFISVAAGVLDAPLRPYLAATVAGTLVWCFGLAGAGWALGASWDRVHHGVRVAEIALVIVAVAAAGALLVRRRTTTSAG